MSSKTACAEAGQQHGLGREELRLLRELEFTGHVRSSRYSGFRKVNGLLQAVCASFLLVMFAMDVGLLTVIAVAESWVWKSDFLFFSPLSS